MRSSVTKTTLILLFSLFPLGASAQVSVTEIMYDLEGTDSGREWIEVKNDSGQPVDLTDWVFFENDTNHGLNAVQGNGTIAAGAYAVIADDAAAFQADWPGYGGALFDSSFSLNNTGEALSMKDPSGTVVDSVTYKAEWGAAGDGNSLNVVLGAWKPREPSPGASPAGNVLDSGSGDDTEASTSEDESNSEGQGSSSSDDYVFVERHLAELEAGGDRTVTVGEDELYEAQAYDQRGSELHSIAYAWNFGNGVVAEGQRVYHQYRFPGEYIVSVTATTPQGNTKTDRVVVTAEPMLLSISEATPQYIAVANESARQIDLSGWSLRVGAKAFHIPHGTTVLPGKTVRFSSAVTGLAVQNASDVALLYPSGRAAYQYGASRNTADASPTRDTTVSSASARSSTASSPEESEREISAASPLAAAERTKQFDGGNNLYLWLLALTVLLVVSIGGLLFVRAKDEDTSEASQYRIIDESDKA